MEDVEPSSEASPTTTAVVSFSYPTILTQTEIPPPNFNGDLFPISLTSDITWKSASRSPSSSLRQNACKAYRITLSYSRVAISHVRSASSTFYHVISPHFTAVIHGPFRTPLRSDLIVASFECIIFTILRGALYMCGYTGLIFVAVLGGCVTSYCGFHHGHREIEQASGPRDHLQEEDSEDEDDEEEKEHYGHDNADGILAFPRYTNLPAERLRMDGLGWTFRDIKKVFKHWAVPVLRATVNFFLVVPMSVVAAPVGLIYFAAWWVGRMMRDKTYKIEGVGWRRRLRWRVKNIGDVERGAENGERGRKPRLDSVQDDVGAL